MNIDKDSLNNVPEINLAVTLSGVDMTVDDEMREAHEESVREWNLMREHGELDEGQDDYNSEEELNKIDEDKAFWNRLKILDHESVFKSTTLSRE